MILMEEEGRPTVYIELEDFRALFAARIAEAKQRGLTMAEYAREIGIERTLLYSLLKGERMPSEAILEKLGARYVIAVGPEPRKKKRKPAKRV